MTAAVCAVAWAAAATTTIAQRSHLPDRAEVDVPIPTTVLWDGAALVGARGALWADGPAPAQLAAAAKALAADAAKQMVTGPFSVLNKTKPPSGGTLHDYWSVGSYWWNCTAECDTSLFANCSAWKHSDLGPSGPPFANCSVATGLPWYDHDGYENPINDNLDPPIRSAMASAVTSLALDCFYNNATASGERAAELVRVWFLDPSTRMHPSAAFAQGIPGRCDGRGIGLIDFAADWPAVLDAVSLLSHGGVWGDADAAALRAWFAQWLEYLLGSSNGHDEASAKNNHGTNFDKQAAAVALHLGNTSVAAAICSAAGAKRVAVQVGPSGTLPLEDSRTKSEEYHLYDTKALLELATVCSRRGARGTAGESLFNYTSPKHVGLMTVLQWLAPYAAIPPTKPWPFKQIRTVDLNVTWATIFRLAANADDWRVSSAMHEASAAGHIAASNGSAWLIELTMPLHTAAREMH